MTIAPQRWAEILALRERHDLSPPALELLAEVELLLALVTRAGLEPLPMRRAQIATLLNDMGSRVASGDSFEGSVEYLMPIEQDVPTDTYAMVRAAYRIGNSMGQGGVRLIGRRPA